MLKSYFGPLVLLMAIFVISQPLQTVLANDVDSSPFIVDSGFRVAPNEYSGAFSYTYPLRVPPGRHGLQPQIGLSYSSANTDAANIAGYGWDISIPKIERLAKYGSDDMYSRHDFTSGLSGELEDVSLVDATHGEFGAKFDDGSFLIYEYGTNEIWTATDKSGTVYTFGATSDARLQNPSDSTQVYAWYLSEIRDTNDNTVTYAYAKDGNQVYPTNINYTGHGTGSGLFDVSFNREARADDYTSMSTGFAVTTDERITSIDVKVDGTTAWSYDLAYSAGDNGIRSLLTSITETGKPATTFDYSVADRSFTEDTGFTFPFAISGTTSSSLGVYVFDVDGDSYPDVVKSDTSAQEVYINNGDYTWSLDTNYVVPMAFISSAKKDKGVRIFDANGDGLQDIVQSITQSGGGGLDQGVYLNDGDGTGWTLDTGYVVPIAFVNDVNLDRGVKIIDVDGDGMQDLVKSVYDSGVSTKEVYVNDGDGTGWTLDTGYTIPVDFTVTGSLDNGVVPVDVNGDGLIDLAQAIDPGGGNPLTQGVYINDGDGTGWTADTNYTVPVAFLVATNARYDNGVRLMDVNGDGLVDLLRARQNSTGGLNYALYINDGDGTGWTQDTGYVSPTGFLGFTTDGGADTGSRENDMDGSLLSDIIYSKADGLGGWVDQMFLPDGDRGDLLTEIEFPEGGSSEIVYTSSVANNAGLYFPLQVVDSVTSHDGLGNSSSVTYEYEQGSYYYASEYDRRLAGFGKVTTTDGVGNVSINYFHQGNDTDSTHGESTDDDSKIGKRYRQEVYDDSANLYQVSITDWGNYSLGNNREFVFVNQELELLYDGDVDHIDKATDYTYDNATGNLLSSEFFGQVNGNDNGTYSDTGTGTVLTEYTYATHTNDLVRNAVSSEVVKDHFGTTDKLTVYVYDGLTYGSVGDGNVTKLRNWIGGTDYAETVYTYNTYGLVITTTDPEGGLTTYDYETGEFLQPVVITNDLSQVTTYTYDLATGKALSTTDASGAVFETDYDLYGRPTAMRQSKPDGSSGLDTVRTYAYDDDVLPLQIHEVSYLDSTNTVNLYTYLDGLARVVQIRKEVEDANYYSVNDTVYDAAGRVEAISLAYFSSGSAKTTATTNADLWEEYVYDALGRVVSVTNALGTSSSVYDQWAVTETDANGEVKTYAHNARGLLIGVGEYIGGNLKATIYQYTTNNQLKKYTDSLGNVRNFTYDKLGRRTSAEDLHATSDTEFGTWTYTYNKLGNLLTTTDANGKVITNTFDSLGRVLTENDPATGSTDVTYTYDTGCANGDGKLCSVTDINSVTTAYTYDLLSRVATVAKTIDSVARTTTNTYDRQGNVLTITHPDATKQEFTYGTAGRIASAGWRDAGGTFTPLLTGATYSEVGAPAVLGYANGTEINNAYDNTELYRLSEKQTTLGSTWLQDFIYTYDAVGNLTQIVDDSDAYSASVTHVMQYDDLHRLTQSVSTSTDSNLAGTRNYAYNSVGNITSGPLGTYQYNSTGSGIFSNPHAATTIGSLSLTYDKNGNQLTDGTWTHAWDFKNRLITSTSTGNTVSYLYDYSGNRIKKTDTTSGTPTYYIDGSYEVEGTKTRHHVSAPGVGSIATVTTDTSSTETIYHLADHLGSTHIEVDDSGVVQEWKVYEPFGEVRHSYQAGTYNNSKTFTGKELDNETNLQYFGARYYDNVQGRFTSLDPLYLSLGSGDLTGLSDPQMWNSYAYGRNNPYSMIDPDGQSFWNVVAAMSRAVDTTYNFITLGSGDIARDMARNGVTAEGVARVAGGVITGAVTTGATAAAAGYAAGSVAVQTGIASVAPAAVHHESTVSAAVESVAGATGGGMTVYQSVKDGVVEYVGITNNLARRASEHLGQSGREIQAIPGATNLTTAAARGVEQVLIEQNGLASNGGTLSNLINSISLNNPNYQRLVDLGKQVLDSIQ